MSEDSILKCLIAFVLGLLVAHMMRGNGFRAGAQFDLSDLTKKGAGDDDVKEGCMDPKALNYNAEATDSDDSCNYVEGCGEDPIGRCELEPKGLSSVGKEIYEPICPGLCYNKCLNNTLGSCMWNHGPGYSV